MSWNSNSWQPQGGGGGKGAWKSPDWQGAASSTEWGAKLIEGHTVSANWKTRLWDGGSSYGTTSQKGSPQTGPVAEPSKGPWPHGG